MLDSLFSHLGDGVLVARIDGRIERANPAAGELFGIPASALPHMRERELLVSVADADRLSRRKVGEVVEWEGVIDRRDGTRRFVRFASTLVVEGGHTLACTIVRALPGQESSREELDRQARRFRAMFDGIHEAVGFLEPVHGEAGQIISFKYVEANAALEKYLGISPLVGKSVEQVVGADVFSERVQDRVRRYSEVLSFGEPWEYHSTLWGRHISVRVFRQSTDVLGIAILDLTEQLQTAMALNLAQQQVQATDEELTAVLDAVPAAVWIARDAQADRIESNRYGQELLRSARGANVSITAPEAERPRNFTPMRGGKAIPPDELPLQQSARFGRSIRDAEFELVFDDGDVRHMLGGSEPLRDAAGNVRGAVGAFIDITERKRGERALADALGRFDTFMAALPAIAFIKDEGGRILYLNQTAERILGWTRDHWLLKTAHDLVPADAAAAMQRDDERALATDAPVVTLERTGDDHAGTTRWWNTVRFVVTGVSGERFVGGISIDVTEQQLAEQAIRASEARALVAQHELEQALEVSRRTEEKFRQAQKMEAVGRLAGGVAHDFNNILTVILGNGELLAQQLRGEPMAADVDEIVIAGRRASELTRQLLAFSRKQVLEPRVLNLNTVIGGMERMLARLLGEDIELAFLLSRNLHLTRVDAGQIEQVLMNLAVNSRDAMPMGGRLTIETSNVTLDEEYARSHPEATPGPHVMLSISDTGDGMSREIQSHLFEPFFTTKAQGKGTGLGLSTVYGIVRQSGGVIWVYSEPGQGTTFKIYLPRAGDIEDPVPAPRPDATSLRGSETVLLVEDDAQVRLVLAMTLRRAGYHVIEAANGGEALLVCEQHGGSIALLLTDIVMPKMNGRQLAERLRVIRPDMRVVFMSGYTENVVVHHGVVDSGIDFLQKPLTADVLLPKLREVLERPGKP